MNAYEKFVNVMRKAGTYNNAPTPQIGIVSGRGKIKVDTQELEPDDYLLDCNLRLDDKEKIYLHSSRPSSGEYITDSSHNGTLKEYSDNVLRTGDKVLLLKMTGVAGEIEKFIVLSMVVEAK